MARARSPRPAERTALFDKKLVRGLGLVLGLGVILAGIVAVGHFTRNGIQNWQRYSVPFSDIACLPPPGQTRAEFLAEVRELAEFPEQLQIVDDDLAARLGKAFGRHPAVEQVVAVVIDSSRQIQVRLIYRAPELKVLLTENPREPSHTTGERSWIVDRHGVVLPRHYAGEKLPIFFATVPPAGPFGQRWGDPSVEAAAATAGYLRLGDSTSGKRYQDKLDLKVFEFNSGHLILCTLAGTRVLWGHAPGAEAAGEAAAATKLERLHEYCEQNKSLDKPAGRYEHDVRPLDQATHKPLPLEG
jgi:hypothetical protein